VIDTATNTVVGAPLSVGSSPSGITTSPDNNRVHVGFSGGPAVVDTSGPSPVLLAPVALPTGSRDLAFKP
jgi:DNA-binding beta-propeller fold protein YncE